MRLPAVWRIAVPLLLVAANAGLAACGQAEPDRSPERIVLVVIDTLRRDHVSAYGGSTPTPNMDALAASGERFERALSSFHMTSMSMGALMTGRTPSIELGDGTSLRLDGRTWCGLTRFAEAQDASCVPASVPTLAESLKQAGFATIGVASNLFLFDPAGFSRGFDDWTEVAGRPSKSASKEDRRRALVAGRSAEKVNTAVAAALDRRTGPRFFLYVHYMDTHDYAWAGIPYADAVERADAGLGGLMAILEERGLTRDALVVVTSDHGERLGEDFPAHAGRSHEGNPSARYLLEVPLVASPGLPTSTDDVVRGDDLFALLLAAAGAPAQVGSLLTAGELFVSEARWQTLHSDGLALHRSRATGELLLYDALAPGDGDVAATQPERVARGTRRMDELARQLASEVTTSRGLTPEDEERLRALGYLD